MSKLTLDELKNKYADRPQIGIQPARVEKLAPIEKPIEVETEKIIAPVSVQPRKQKMSNAPLISFLAFAGIAMFAGFAVLVNLNLTEDTQVLGETDYNNDVEIEGEDNSDEIILNNINSEDEENSDEENNAIIDETEEDENEIENIDEEELVVDSSEMGSSNEESDSLEIEENNVSDLETENEDSSGIIFSVSVVDVTGGYVNLRKVPNMNTSAFSRVSSGTKLDVVSETEVDGYDWYEVVRENENLWIRADFVEKL